MKQLRATLTDDLGIKKVACAAQSGYPEALSYNFDDSGVGGASNSSTGDGCGGHANLHLSAQELVDVAASAYHDSSIVNSQYKNEMETSRAGWNSRYTMSNGQAYAHGGDWYRGNGRETHTCILKFPKNIEMSIIVNSAEPRDVCRVARDAYEEGL